MTYRNYITLKTLWVVSIVSSLWQGGRRIDDGCRSRGACPILLGASCSLLAHSTVSHRVQGDKSTHGALCRSGQLAILVQGRLFALVAVLSSLPSSSDDAEEEHEVRCREDLVVHAVTPSAPC